MIATIAVATIATIESAIVAIIWKPGFRLSRFHFNSFFLQLSARYFVEKMFERFFLFSSVLSFLFFAQTNSSKNDNNKKYILVGDGEWSTLVSNDFNLSKTVEALWAYTLVSGQLYLATLTKPRLNSSSYKLCIYTFSLTAISSCGHFFCFPKVSAYGSFDCSLNVSVTSVFIGTLEEVQGGTIIPTSTYHTLPVTCPRYLLISVLDALCFYLFHLA